MFPIVYCTLFTSRMPEMLFTLKCSIVCYSAIWIGVLAIFMPPDWMIGGILFLSCLSVRCCLSVSVVNFNLRYNFRTVRDRDFIFGMHTPEWRPFKWHQGQWPCDLDCDLEAKNSFFGLCCRRGHTVVFHKHPLIFDVLINCDMGLLFDKFIDDYFFWYMNI